MSCKHDRYFGDFAPEILPSINIVLQNIGKTYQLHSSPYEAFRSLVLNKTSTKEFVALQDISFTVSKGEALGIIGHNGAGKSTLLQILAGSLRPSHGRAWIRGRVAALLELGSGFLPDFTGRENVYANGIALGLSTLEITNKIEEIQQFAEIGNFFDQPVRNYSSGMFVRLAFAVQACITPDVLIVDEALAVGDIFFQQKCHTRMERLLAAGTSILLVTHDTHAVRRYCSRVALLDHGKLIHLGDVEKGLRLYYDSQLKSYENTNTTCKAIDFEEPNSEKSLQNTSPTEQKKEDVYIFDFKSIEGCCFNLKKATIIEAYRAVKIANIAMTDTYNSPKSTFQQGATARFHVLITALNNIERPIIGITIYTIDNIPLYCMSSFQGGDTPPRILKQNESRYYSWDVTLNIARGQYLIAASAAHYQETAFQLLTTDISAEEFATLSTSLVSIHNIGSVTIDSPARGLSLPFVGLADLPTTVKSQTTSCAVDI